MMALHKNFAGWRGDDTGRSKRTRAVGKNVLGSPRLRKVPQQRINLFETKHRPIGLHQLSIEPVRLDVVRRRPLALPIFLCRQRVATICQKVYCIVKRTVAGAPGCKKVSPRLAPVSFQ